MKKSEVVYLSALVMIAPHVHQGIAMIMCGVLTLCAVAFDVMERK